jgi:transposase
MAPLVRRTLAPSGQTPVLKQRAAHRDKVSLSAALCLSPRRGRLSLRFRTYPKQYVNNERTAEFLRDLLRQVRGRVIVVWDQGNMHKGSPIRELLRRFPRLELRSLPPYAPELNPVEQLWNHLKYNRFVNQAPLDVLSLNGDLQRHLKLIRRNPARLRSFLAAADLPFD